jgi:signal peptidase I
VERAARREERPSEHKSRRELREERRLSRLEARRGRKRGPVAGLLELVLTVAVAFLLVFGFVRPYVVMSYYTPTESMVPTIEPGTDRVLANKFIYRFEEPERGDVVVLDDPDGGGKPLLKRVVGLPGDRIQVQDGLLFVNGERIDEPYLNVDEVPDASVFGPVTVPKGDVFVMGDNRGRSKDSRFFGPVPIDSLEGEAFLRFWPLDRLEVL